MSIAPIAEKTKYLTFKLEKNIFAFDINKVREVLNAVPVTIVPGMPDYMCGVINLRGGAVPIADLRTMFTMAQNDLAGAGIFIIVEVQRKDEGIVIGIKVDSVEEVFEMPADRIEPAPELGKALNAEYIKGMGRREDEFVIILDIDRIFSADDLETVQRADSSMNTSDMSLDGENTDSSDGYIKHF